MSIGTTKMRPLTALNQSVLLIREKVKIHNGLPLRPLSQIKALLTGLNRLSIDTEIRALVRYSITQLNPFRPPCLDRATVLLSLRSAASQGKHLWQTNIDNFPLALKGEASHCARLAKEVVQPLTVAQIVAQTVQRIEWRQQKEVVEFRHWSQMKEPYLMANRAIASVDALDASTRRRFRIDVGWRRHIEEDDVLNRSAMAGAFVG
jgi:hypothetical protein